MCFFFFKLYSHFFTIQISLIKFSCFCIGVHDFIPLCISFFLFIFHFLKIIPFFFFQHKTKKFVHYFLPKFSHFYLNFFHLSCLLFPNSFKFLRAHSLVSRSKRFFRASNTICLFLRFSQKITSNMIINFNTFVFLFSCIFKPFTFLLFLRLNNLITAIK